MNNLSAAPHAALGFIAGCVFTALVFALGVVGSMERTDQIRLSGPGCVTDSDGGSGQCPH